MPAPPVPVPRRPPWPARPPDVLDWPALPPPGWPPASLTPPLPPLAVTIPPPRAPLPLAPPVPLTTLPPVPPGPPPPLLPLPPVLPRTPPVAMTGWPPWPLWPALPPLPPPPPLPSPLCPPPATIPPESATVASCGRLSPASLGPPSACGNGAVSATPFRPAVFSVQSTAPASSRSNRTGRQDAPRPADRQPLIEPRSGPSGCSLSTGFDAHHVRHPLVGNLWTPNRSRWGDAWLRQHQSFRAFPPARAPVSLLSDDRRARVQSPSPAHAVQPAGRGDSAGGSVSSGVGPRDEVGRHHRPREPVRGAGLLRDGQEARREADLRLRDLRGARPPRPHRTQEQPSDLARVGQRRLAEPVVPQLDGLPGGVLLQPPHRQGAAAAAQPV